MDSRVLRPIAKAVVAAGTAGAIATACWLLDRILDDDTLKCTDAGTSDLHLKATTTVDDYNTTVNYHHHHQECNTDESFALLPLVADSDDKVDEVNEDVLDYTADHFTPHYDVCIVSVTVETVDDVPFHDSSEDRLCSAAVNSCDSIGNGIQRSIKHRTLSFSNTEACSNDSELSLSSECGEEDDMQRFPMCSKSQPRLYVRL